MQYSACKEFIACEPSLLHADKKEVLMKYPLGGCPTAALFSIWASCVSAVLSQPPHPVNGHGFVALTDPFNHDLGRGAGVCDRH